MGNVFTRTPNATNTTFFNTNPTAGEVLDKLIVWLVSAEGIPDADILSGKSDALMSIEAIGANTGSTDKMKLDTLNFKVLPNVSDVPDWNRKRFIVFKRGSVSRFRLVMVDQDAFGTPGRELFRFEDAIPGAEYKEYTLPFSTGGGRCTFRVRVDPAEHRLISRSDVESFPLQQEIFRGLSGNNGAVLAYHAKPGNKTALLWLPGRADYFYHPHVGKALEAHGVDVHVLNYRRCGLSRPAGLFTNPYLVRSQEGRCRAGPPVGRRAQLRASRAPTR